MRYALPVGLALCLALSACGVDSGTGITAPSVLDSGPITLANGSMSAKLDGSTFNARFLAADVLPFDALFTPIALFTITGSGSNLRLITISVPSPPVVGTLTIDQDGTSFLLTEDRQEWRADKKADGSVGTVTFTTVTANRVVGTFSFTAPPVFGTAAIRTVTDGTFEVRF